MRSIILIALTAFVSNVYGQVNYTSSVTTKYNSKSEIIEKQRTITISDKEVTITNFVGGTQSLNLKVNEIKEKKDDFDGLMKWYYCMETEKDVLSGKYTEFIIIMKKSNPSNISVCQKVDEVTFIKTVLSLR